MNLTEACKPRTFYGKTWYYDTTTSLKDFQEEAAKRDDEEKQKKRQVLMTSALPVGCILTVVSSKQNFLFLMSRKGGVA